MIKKYLYAPKDIHTAIKFTGDNLEEVKEFLGDYYVSYIDGALTFRNYTALEGHYIVSYDKGIFHHYLVCNEIQFNASYKEVE